MIKYYNYDVVFSEIPDEITLAINISGCPNRCPGCHSPHLWQDTGHPLDYEELCALLDRYSHSVTCVCFMGGDGDPHGIARLAGIVRRHFPALHTGWYSGCPELPQGINPEIFDYIKLGGYVEALGPLTSPGTNQRLYRIGPGGSMEDITERFQHRPVPEPSSAFV